MVFVYIYVSVLVVAIIVAIVVGIKERGFRNSRVKNIEDDINRMRNLQDIEYFRKISGIDRIPFGKPPEKE